MKIYMSRYPKHVSTMDIANKLLFFATKDTKEKLSHFLSYGFKSKIVNEKIDNCVSMLDYPQLSTYETLFKKALNKFNNRNKINYVHIDGYDVWNMSDTINYIIHPCLIKLKSIKQGAPDVDNDDVPEYLQCHTSNDLVDDNYFKRWDYVLDEMIYAFNPNHSDNLEFDDEHLVRVKKGRILFAKYYSNLWD